MVRDHEHMISCRDAPVSITVETAVIAEVSIYEKTVIRQAHRLLKDQSHVLYSEYELLPSGRRCGASKCKTNRHQLSFVCPCIRLQNKGAV